MALRQFIGGLEAPAVSLTIGEATKQFFDRTGFIHLFLNLKSNKKLYTMIVFCLILVIQKI